MGWIGYISIVGVAAAGTAGVGHTGGNLYEEMHPTRGVAMKKQGYTFVPVEPPGEKKPNATAGSVKFTWQSGGCFKRLFPGVEVTHNIPEDSDKADAPSEKIVLSNSADPAYKDYIGCTTMDMSPWGNENKHIYYKSETVIKNDQVGIAVWTGLSTGDRDTNTSKTEFDLFYRLIFLQKSSEGTGEIKRGFRWIPVTLEGNNDVYDKYFIKSPDDYWINGLEQSKGPKPIEEKSGSGVWEPVSTETEGNHPGKDIEVHTCISDDPEKVFGADSPFEEPDSNAGGDGLTVGYDPLSKRGKKLKDPSSIYQAKEELKSGYAPFKNQKGKGTEMRTRCVSEDTNRNLAKDFSDELKHLCYSNQVAPQP